MRVTVRVRVRVGVRVRPRFGGYVPECFGSIVLVNSPPLVRVRVRMKVRENKG